MSDSVQSIEWEVVGDCGVCGCAPVPTYPVGDRADCFDGAERACCWCMKEHPGGVER